MNRKAPARSLDVHELDELILRILARSRFGLPANKIHKELPPSFRRSAGETIVRLDSLLAGGHIHVFNPPIGKAKKPPASIYSLGPLVPIVSTQIIQILTPDKILTPAEIKKQLPAHIAKHLRTFLDPLVGEKRVMWHPPAKGKSLALHKPNPADFLYAEISKIFKKGEKLGFATEAILRAVQTHIKPSAPETKLPLTAEETQGVVFKAMTSLKPAASQGALVYIPDLRHALCGTFPDKESFDQAIVRLAELEKVQLQSHSLPAELTEEQRAAMIDNGRGSYFMAVGIRME